ncbi:MAG TPA: tetratricopeptide repeat protein [Candidatus Acidoferrales bacterium]|jgi:tetratricopeptide (TPR) repeat protein|nr:tetratricopeptide repeat protein [Candidatus Acidoferrales bacterium]
MRASRICVALLAAIPLLGQTSGRLLERIQNAPLTPDERQAVTAAFSQKDFDRLEAILLEKTPAGATGSEALPDRAAALGALLGALEFLSGRMKQAVQAFRRADGLRPLDDRDRFTFAMALVDLGDVKASRTELALLNERHANQPIYLYWLARLDYGQRLYDDAVEKLKRVTSLDPASVRGYDNLGLSYDMMGLTEEAQAAFAKAVALNRQLPAPSPWPPHNLGYLQLRLQQYGGAEENLREALKYDPKFALAHYHLARVLEDEARESEARQNEARQNEARQNEARNDAAIEEYKTAAALDVKLAEPLYSLGLLYRRRGRDAEAASALAEYRRRKALGADSP